MLLKRNQPLTNRTRSKLKARVIYLIWLAAAGHDLATPADATTVRARYSVTYMGLPVGSVSTESTIGGTSYQTDVAARVSGLATIASTFKMNMKSNGSLRKNAVQPDSFAADETGLGEDQTMRLTLVGGTVKSAEVNPPVKDLHQRVALLDKHKKNVVDPASSLILTVPPGQEPFGAAACNRTIRFFDGITRADFLLEFVKMEEMKAAGYEGRVSVCSVRYFPIAGHNPAAAMTTFMQSNNGIQVRLAAVPDTQQLILVSATIPLLLGSASLEMQQLQIAPSVLSSAR